MRSKIAEFQLRMLISPRSPACVAGSASIGCVSLFPAFHIDHQQAARRSDAIVRAQTAGGKHEVVRCTSVHSDLSASGMIHFAARTRSTNAGVHHGYDGKLQQSTQANTATLTIQDMFETGRGGTWTEY
jgi:hypothetical protein